MATVFKNEDLQFKEDPERIDNFRLFTAYPRLSSVVKSKNLMFDMRLLNPGQYSFPYHYHRNAEELMMVIKGSMTLRTSGGLEIVNTGDIIFIEMGEKGVHQYFNHTNESCTYLDIRTFFNIDVVEYPDSGKVNILPERQAFDKSSAVDYFKGEENVAGKWKNL